MAYVVEAEGTAAGGCVGASFA